MSQPDGPDRGLIESALEAVRPGLQADGFDLRVEEVRSGGEVVICLQAGPDACLECLVPDEVLVQIIKNGIAQQADATVRITLLKRGFGD